MSFPLTAALRPLWRRLLRLPSARRALLRAARSLEHEAWAAWQRDRFIQSGAGAAHGMAPRDRAELCAAFDRIAEEVPSGTPPPVHIALAEAVLSIPPGAPGVVVECGAWKGASSAALSLACAWAGRRLIICDSFQGLPDDGGRRHFGLHTGVYGHYRAGMFAGSEAEVRDTVARHGAPGVCDYVPGFFADSLPGAITEPVAFAFLDVDLAGSTRDCLAALWPRLVDDALIFSDDAGDLDVVRVFFDEAWWRDALGCDAPGFVGSGCGLPLRPGHSSLGYARKVVGFDPAAWRRVPFLDYPEDADAETR